MYIVETNSGALKARQDSVRYLDSAGMGAIMGSMRNYSVVEDGREIYTGASLWSAAQLWTNNPTGRRVYEMFPSGPLGPDAWQKEREVTPDELLAAFEDPI